MSQEAKQFSELFDLACHAHIHNKPDADERFQEAAAAIDGKRLRGMFADTLMLMWKNSEYQLQHEQIRAQYEIIREKLFKMTWQGMKDKGQ